VECAAWSLDGVEGASKLAIARDETNMAAKIELRAIDMETP